MGPQHQGFGVLRVELLQQAVPEETSSTQHGDFHEEIHADAEEEGQARCKGIDIHARPDSGAYIFHTVSQGKGALEDAIGTGFHDVVAADADGVVFRHIFRSVCHDVRDNPHGRCRADKCRCCGSGTL